MFEKNSFYNSGMTPLHVEAYVENPEVCKILLQNGVEKKPKGQIWNYTSSFGL